MTDSSWTGGGVGSSGESGLPAGTEVATPARSGGAEPAEARVREPPLEFHPGSGYSHWEFGLPGSQAKREYNPFGWKGLLLGAN